MRSVCAWLLLLSASPTSGGAAQGGGIVPDAWTDPRPPKPAFDVGGERPVTLGPFHPRPPVALYVLVNRPCARGRVVVSSREGDNVLLRVFDAGERLVHWQYAEPDLEAPIEHPRDPYAAGLPALPISTSHGSGRTCLDGSFALVGEGVHQIRITASGWHGGSGKGTTAAVALSQPLPWGVSCQNGLFLRWGGCPSRLYAFVPPRAQGLWLAVRRGRIQVLDEHDRPVSPDRDGRLPVGRREVVWTFEVGEEPFQFKAWGFPLILCDSPETARAIRASIEQLPDGTVVAHRFQRAIAELMPELLAPRKVGRAEDLIVPLDSRREAWLKDPERNLRLFGWRTALPRVPFVLRRQIVDPSHPFGGCYAEKDRSGRWDTYLPVRDLGGSWHRDTATFGSYALAFAATLNHKGNPYFGKKELLHRAAAGCLRDLMVLNEAEVWPEAAKDPYPSRMSFPMGASNLPPFGLAAPLLPPGIRAPWTEGLRRLMDRAYTNGLVSCRNQSSHCLVANEHFFQGTGDPVYERLSRLYARRFIRGGNPAGWHMEAGGPCGSYIGMTHWHMAAYAHMSGDAAMIEAVARSYRYFNHTVAPEPAGGAVLGGFNFNHRVTMGFLREQYGGAKGILSGKLPEVGLWGGPAPTPHEARRRRADARERLAKALAEPRDEFPGSHWDIRYDAYAEPDRSGVWPALEPGSFIRNFADDLVAVKRPAYYLVVYVGKPAAPYQIGHRRPAHVEGVWREVERQGGVPEKYTTPYTGGGLSTLWTPAYGTSVMAANWSPYTHHGLVARSNQDRWTWEDYYAVSFDLDERAGTLVVTGRIEEQPLRYARLYRFRDRAVEVKVTVEAEEPVRLRRFVENIPFVIGENAKAKGASVVFPGGVADAAEADRFEVVDRDGQGVRFSLDRTLPMRTDIKSAHPKYNQFRLMAVEIDLPASLDKGDSVRVTYTISGK